MNNIQPDYILDMSFQNQQAQLNLRLLIYKIIRSYRNNRS